MSQNAKNPKSSVQKVQDPSIATEAHQSQKARHSQEQEPPQATDFGSQQTQLEVLGSESCHFGQQIASCQSKIITANFNCIPNLTKNV